MSDFRSLSEIRFSDPGWLPALYGLPIIVILYLLRRRAAKLVVPHLPIWEKVLERMKRRSPWTRTLLSILLQMLVFASAILLLAGPYTRLSERGRGHSIVVVDRSLGVASRGDDGRPLLEAVSAAARRLLSQCAQDGPTSLSVLHGGPVPRHLASEDIASLVAALDASRACRGGRRLAEVAALRETVGAASRIVYVSPFAPTNEETAVLEENGVDLVPVPGAVPQAGITAVVRKNDVLRVTVSGGGPGRHLVLRAGGEELSRVEVTPNGEDVDAEVMVPPGVAEAADLELVPPDGFPDDDHVPLTFPDRPQVPVLVVAPGPTPWLDAWLSASAFVDVEASGRIDPDMFPPEDRTFDVVILVDTMMDLPLPDGRYLLVASGAPDLPIVRDTRVRGPSEPVFVKKDDPLVRALDLSRWEIKDVAATRAKDGLEVIVRGSSGPLVSRARLPGMALIDVAVAAESRSSTWPLMAAFPLLLDAALLELSGNDGAHLRIVFAAGGECVLETGTPPVFVPEDGSAAVETGPLSDGTGYRVPDRPGRYRIGSGDGARAISVALLDHPGRPGAAAGGDPALTPFPERHRDRSLRYVLLVVLGVTLLLEWWLYQLALTD